MPGTGAGRADGGTEYAAEVADLVAVVGCMVLGKAAVGLEDGDDAIEPGIVLDGEHFGTVAVGEGGGAGLEQANASLGWDGAGDVLRFEEADLLDQESEHAVVAVESAAVAVDGESEAVVGAAGGAAHFFRTDECVALKGGEVLADGHGGEAEGGGKLVDGATVVALEEGEDIGLR